MGAVLRREVVAGGATAATAAVGVAAESVAAAEAGGDRNKPVVSHLEDLMKMPGGPSRRLTGSLAELGAAFILMHELHPRTATVRLKH